MKKDSDIHLNYDYQSSHTSQADAAEMSGACHLLRQAKIRNSGLLSHGSNYVFLVTLVKEGVEIKAIYKPRQGEVPLWDFPEGTLYKREYAAFIVSQALEWCFVPPTVIRDGPYGVGSMQLFVESGNRPEYYLQIKDLSVLKRVALFDFLVNNADRKAGHFLQGKDGRLWLVDHGLTFNAEPKLRTVLWDFSGEAIPEGLLGDVRVLQSKLKQQKQLRDALRHLLSEPELKALERRIDTIIEKPVFVSPGPYRSVPWPWY